MSFTRSDITATFSKKIINIISHVASNRRSVHIVRLWSHACCWHCAVCMEVELRYVLLLTNRAAQLQCLLQTRRASRPSVSDVNRRLGYLLRHTASEKAISSHHGEPPVEMNIPRRNQLPMSPIMILRHDPLYGT